MWSGFASDISLDVEWRYAIEARKHRVVDAAQLTGIQSTESGLRLVDFQEHRPMNVDADEPKRGSSGGLRIKRRGAGCADDFTAMTARSSDVLPK
jgi:hypothetical protein